MLRKTMVVLAALLAVGLGQMLPGGPVAVPDQGILVKPGPIAGHRSGVAADGTDAGYILKAIYEGGNGYMYGPAGYGGYSMGFRFTPLTSGAITKIGRYRGTYNETSTCKLWDAANGDQLASASVSGSDWSYVDISPVMVEMGHEYYVTTYGGSYVYYYYLSAGVPFDMNDVRLLYGAYYYGDGMPTSNGGTYVYGCADFYFEPWPSNENWTGAVSTDWAADGNWDGGHAPAVGITVNIPGGCSNYPTTNSGSSYGAKTLDIADGASLTILSGKPLTLSGDFSNAGTFLADGDVTCRAGLLNNAGGDFTISVGATLSCAGDLYNAGTMTNGGSIICPKNFTNGGTFTSGTYSELHFTGSSDATFDAGSADAGSGLYNLFVEKVLLDVKMGENPEAYGSYFGGNYTQMPKTASTVDGDISSWSCYTYMAGSIRTRVYRAGYNGYQWGMVTQGALQTCVYGFNEFTEDIPGVEVGDRIASYPCLGICFGYDDPGMLIYLGDANPGANGWYDWGYGPTAHQATIKAPAGDLTSTGDVAIAGELKIETDNDLNVSGSGHYTASGLWTNNGGFNPGAGTVTFDGESQIAGTATHTFNNLGITGTLYAPSEMTVGGNWNCSGTFDHSSGTVTFTGGSITSGGQPFSKLTINSTSDGDVALNDDVTVEKTLTLTSGNFLVGPHTLTLGTASGAATAAVNGGLFSVVGTGSSARGTVTAADAGRPYSLTVNAGAGIAAKYANFTWMGPNGIDVRIGATIDATNNLSWTWFTAGNTPGTMLKIANSQTLDDISNTSFTGTDGYNIDYGAGTGHLTVTDGGGSRWGAAFENDPNNKLEWATTTLHDVGVTAILTPAGTVGEHMTVFPKVTVKNFGEAAENFDVRVIISNGTDAEVFNHVEQVTGLAIGETRSFTFTVNSWDPTPQGDFHVLAQSELAGDRVPENDKVELDFTVGPPYAPGWHLHTQMPAGAKPLKDGAWLAYDAGAMDGTGLIFASRGYKQSDFYSYDLVGDVWTKLAPWQLGTEGKMPSKGSVGCADGNGVIYATKGNNKQGFWGYDAAANVWTQLADVPLGLSNKKVKGGTGIAWAYNGGTGSPYLLKGYKNEFYRYDVATNTWQTLAPAPGNVKWDKGSWLVSDGAHTLYAHQAKYHGYFSYDTETGLWSEPLVGMPMAGSGGSKKAKDGSCATYTPAGDVRAFKGGNTVEFWKCTFTTDGNSWGEKEPVPSGTPRKKVKAGASMVAVGGLVIATKGNKDNGLYMYVPTSFAPEPPAPQHDGVQAGKTEVAQGVSISPNPLATGFAVLRYGLPKAGAARLNVYNMAGQTVMTRTLAAGRSGNVNLDLRHLSNGVYLVKLSSEGFENSQKLVVQR